MAKFLPLQVLFSVYLSVVGVRGQVLVPTGTLATVLPRATDAKFGNFASDGGAGGYVKKWNQHLFSLSDPDPCSTSALDSPCNFIPSAHTGYAVMDSQDPSKLTVIADYYRTDPQSIATPDFWHGDQGTGVLPYIASADIECDNPTCFSPAPHVAAIPIPGNDTGLLNVWPVHPNERDYTYNTMFEMDFFVNADYLNNPFRRNVPVQRIVPRLFDVSKGQAGYGSAALTSARGDDAAVHFFLWEGDSTGFKLARAPWATRRDRTTYSYWHGADGWVRNAPLRYNGDAYGNVVNVSRPALGVFGTDVRYVTRFNTYIIIFQGAAGGDAEIMYSTSGKITGPYSAPKKLFTPPLDPGCNYGNNAGHVFPFTNFVSTHWDYLGTDADRVLVSWMSCGRFQNVGYVKWQ